MAALFSSDIMTAFMVILCASIELSSFRSYYIHKSQLFMRSPKENNCTWRKNETLYCGTTGNFFCGKESQSPISLASPLKFSSICLRMFSSSNSSCSMAFSVAATNSGSKIVPSVYLFTGPESLGKL